MCVHFKFGYNTILQFVHGAAYIRKCIVQGNPSECETIARISYKLGIRWKPTLLNVLQRSAYSPVKGPCISWTLKGQAKLFVVDSPVMEDGIDFVVNQVSLDVTLQHNLDTEWENTLIQGWLHGQKLQKLKDTEYKRHLVDTLQLYQRYKFH